MQIVKQQSGAERGAWLAIAGQWVKVEIDADRFSVIVTGAMRLGSDVFAQADTPTQ